MCFYEQSNPYFWDGDSSYQIVVVLFFHFEEMSFIVIRQLVDVVYLKVFSALD